MGEKERGTTEEAESRQKLWAASSFRESAPDEGAGDEAGGAGDAGAMASGGGKSGGKGDPTTQAANLNLSKSNVNRSAGGDDGDDAVEAAINNSHSNIKNL